MSSTIVRTLEEREVLDRAADPAQGAVRAGLGKLGTPAAGFLHGTWLGHPLHVVLADVPIGAWSVAAVGIGLAAAPTAMSGLAGWSQTDGGAKRTALVHGLLNTLAAGCYVTSCVLRRRKQRSRARAWAFAGYGLMAFSAYLGGELVYGGRIGFSHAPRDLPAEWAPVLAEGKLEDSAVRCPWHGSLFSLEDGRVLEGPAVHRQPCLEARVSDGWIEVRAAKG